MSRWDEEFRSHPFRAIWGRLMDEVFNLGVDDLTIETNVQELARLKKIISYIHTLIEAVDPELVPSSTWSNFLGQAEACLQLVSAYVSNRDMSAIVAANAHADNLLSYVKPYMVVPAEAAQAATNALTNYKAHVEQYLQQVADLARNVLHESQQELLSLKNVTHVAQAQADEIRAMSSELLEGTPERPSTKTEFEWLRNSAQAADREISSYFRRLFADTDQPSIRTTVDQTIGAINRDAEAAQKVLQRIQEKVVDLDIFHSKIFGEIDTNGNQVIGLKMELDERTKQIDILESTQVEKYDAIFTRIETLLPGATSAGLAAAYRAMTLSFETKISTNTRLFYAAVLAIPVIAILFSIDNFTLWPFSISFAPIKEYDELLRVSLAKIPFVAPLVWLAIFASMRRSQYERLQQEYAHKEALAKSYESYKRQLDALQIPDTESLKKELISKAIEAVAFNASTTLNGNHREALPAEALFDFIRDEKNVSVLERLKGLVFPDKK